MFSLLQRVVGSGLSLSLLARPSVLFPSVRPRVSVTAGGPSSK